MAKVKKKAKIKKVRKKKWVQIIAPKMFNEVMIGEIPTLDVNSLPGKLVSVNMMSLTRDPKQQGVNIKFMLDSLMEGDKISTIMTGYEIIPAAVKRMVRRRKSRIDDSFALKTSDGVKVRIKPFILTRTKTNKSTNNALIKATREHFIRAVTKSRYEQFLKDFVAKKIQRGLYEKLNKFHPIIICEVRIMKVENRNVLRGDKNAGSGS